MLFAQHFAQHLCGNQWDRQNETDTLNNIKHLIYIDSIIS